MLVNPEHGKVQADPALFEPLPEDLCDGFETSYVFIFEDYCGHRDTATCTFIVAAPVELVFTCPKGSGNR